MNLIAGRNFAALTLLLGTSGLLAGCGAQPVVNTNVATNIANSSPITNANLPASNTSTATGTFEAKEPSAYQATVNLKLEAESDTQKSSLPTLTAKVARSGDNRRMEFTMPAGGRVVFLDIGGKNLLVLPDKKQFAELNKESTGFDIRRMLMPEQIVQQVKGIQGVHAVGEEKYNGRDVIRYEYGSVTNTQSQAGQVATQSYFLVDKETSLPLRSETVSQSQSGASVQGYKGLRAITEISDLSLDAPADLFQEPTGFQKIESDQVRAQVDMIFSSLASLMGQLMNQAQTVNRTASPTASPTPR